MIYNIMLMICLIMFFIAFIIGGVYDVDNKLAMTIGRIMLSGSILTFISIPILMIIGDWF